MKYLFFSVILIFMFQLSAKDWKLIPNSMSQQNSDSSENTVGHLAQAVYFKNGENDDHIEDMFKNHFSKMAESFGIKSIIPIPSQPVTGFLKKNGFEKNVLKEEYVEQSGIGYELAKYLNSKALLLCYLNIQENSFEFALYFVDTQKMTTHKVSFSCGESDFLKLQSR